MSEHRSFSEFRNPNLSDRELMLLLLYEVARSRADVLALARVCVCLRKAEGDCAQVARIQAEADRETFADLEFDMRQFETRRLPPKKT